jgi:2-amino-4-hydroxy-6-hydroxymethyldihydropteridine diphosphokinase
MEPVEPVVAYIALGSNLGDREENLQAAVTALSDTDGIEVIAVSPVYETEAHTESPDTPAPTFLNAVVSVSTGLAPAALMERLLAIETSRSRRRDPARRWSPRTLDLDVLLYGEGAVRLEGLSVPHPRLGERRFVLRPLADLAPNLHVPEPFGRSVSELLADCADTAAVFRSDASLLIPGRSLASQGELWPATDDQPVRRQVTRLPEDLRYVVIEGVIGAGKTTLASVISRRFGARLIREQFDENPFLESFYEDRERWAFQTQLSFLASRFRQQQSLGGRDLFHDVVVSDYAFDKDRIFARLNLSGDELQLYDTLFRIMQPSVPVPDLVVYLQSSTERLMAQIRARGRVYERNMDPAYIEALNQAYNAYFFHYDRSPLLIVNAARLDFVENSADLEELLSQIARMHYPGTTFFNPVRPV